ncbi:MAG: hypothetical protein J1F05_02645 [Muribaculaceae bacterium]|nr:hypothetical protein [Muribaculaceae bacterium]
MKKSTFILAVCAGIALSAGAQGLSLQKTTPVNKQITSRDRVERVAKSRTIAKGIVEKEVVLENGLKIKMVTGIPSLGNTINPRRKPAKVASTPEGFVLYEDFEAWDGMDDAWLPDGWAIDHRDSPESNRGWKMTEPMPIFDFIESKCLTYEMFDQEVDEWAISPAFDVYEGMELCWGTMTSPYFYNWDYFNSTTFKLDKFEIVNDIKVNISTDGGESWELLYSHAEELIKETDGNFFAMFDYSVRPFSASLEKYVGKTINVGFQIEGIDGNTTFIDDISVGLPLTGASYRRPLSNLFFGLSSTDENVPASIMAGPVYKPMKYTNTTKTSKADYLWTYTDTSGEEKTSTDKNLSVTYETDYTSAATTRNNMYHYPVLSASSAGTAPDSFTYGGFIQAGGRGEYERYFTDTKDYEVVDLGLTIIDPWTEGSATYADLALPYFGYNHESDRYWSQRTFGDEYDDDNWSHLVRIGDLFYSPDSPIVIDGIRTNAYGKVSRNAKFVAEIYFIGRNFVIPDEPNFTATCTGNDITMIDRGGTSDILSFNFKFDEPIVISSDITPYFFVAIGGFHDPENVEYFSPEMSNYGNPNGLALGWIGKEVCFAGDMLPSYGWSDVSYYVNDELVSFYIMLDATFPWLEGNDETINIGNGSSASIELDSYYDGSKLSFEGLPEWLTAKATGRYNKTVVTFTTANTIPDDKANVAIVGPGVRKEVTVVPKNVGVNNVVAAPATGASEVYTLDGRRVNDNNLTPGIYIKREGAKATKILVK